MLFLPPKLCIKPNASTPRARHIALKGLQIDRPHNTHEKRINQYRSQTLNLLFAHLSMIPIQKMPRQ
jgi:hypothetical protein